MGMSGYLKRVASITWYVSSFRRPVSSVKTRMLGRDLGDDVHERNVFCTEAVGELDLGAEFLAGPADDLFGGLAGEHFVETALVSGCVSCGFFHWCPPFID